MIEFLFYRKYQDYKAKHNDLVSVYDEFYNDIINYYDSSRRKVYDLKTIKDKVLYTFIYNISSSSNSLIKDTLIDLNGPWDALLLRNIIESILYYRLLFCFELGNKYYELFYYHHHIFEYSFTKKYHIYTKQEKLSDGNIRRYENSIKLFTSVHQIDKNQAEKILRRRTGWTFGIKGNKTIGTKVIAKLCKEDFLLDLLSRGNLNSIVHLDKKKILLTHEEVFYLMAYVVSILEEINKKLNNKIKKVSLYQLRMGYAKQMTQQRIISKYKPLYDSLGQNKLFKQILKKESKHDIFKELFDADTRFGFECQAYAAGYSYVFVSQLEIVTYILKIINEYGDEFHKTHVGDLTVLFLNMETDFAFGYENEYKMKYRYFIDELLLAFVGEKVNFKFEEFLSKQLVTLGVDEDYGSLIKALYNESCNFVHPNVYGYLGYYSFNNQYTLEYVYSTYHLLQHCVQNYLQKLPISINIYNEINCKLNQLNEKLTNRIKVANEYKSTV